jgi:hypothetical protein
VDLIRKQWSVSNFYHIKISDVLTLFVSGFFLIKNLKVMFEKKLSIAFSGSESFNAWVYVFNHDVSALRQIKSGDLLNKNGNNNRA